MQVWTPEPGIAVALRKFNGGLAVMLYGSGSKVSVWAFRSQVRGT